MSIDMTFMGDNKKLNLTPGSIRKTKDRLTPNA